MKPDPGILIFKTKIKTGVLFFFSLFVVWGMLLTTSGDANDTMQNVHSNAVTARIGPNSN